MHVVNCFTYSLLSYSLSLPLSLVWVISLEYCNSRYVRACACRRCKVNAFGGNRLWSISLVRYGALELLLLAFFSSNRHALGLRWEIECETITYALGTVCFSSYFSHGTIGTFMRLHLQRDKMISAKFQFSVRFSKMLNGLAATATMAMPIFRGELFISIAVCTSKLLFIILLIDWLPFRTARHVQSDSIRFNWCEMCPSQSRTQNALYVRATCV